MRILLDLDKESSVEIEADISMFEEMFAAKVSFYDEMVGNRDAESAVAIADLRQETIYEIAQFYYFIKVFGIDSGENLRVFALSHNANIKDLLDNGSDHDRLGISKKRLNDALFDSDVMLDRLMDVAVIALDEIRENRIFPQNFDRAEQAQIVHNLGG